MANPFSTATIAFLGELRDNNNRDWFGEHKSRYEAVVLDPALEFIQSMQEPLAEFAPHFAAVPKRVGGSLMRVYRDTRFSRNKAPYKTNIGIQFRHEFARDVHSPGYYVHIDPDEVFLGIGMWRPPADALQQVRQRIAERPGEWRRARNDRAFRRRFSLAGESLSRPPRGFDKSHPEIEDLKRKDFIAVRNLSVAEAIDAGFRRRVVGDFRAAGPLMKFLCDAVGVPF